MSDLAPIFTLYRDYTDGEGVTMCIQEYGDVDFLHNEEKVVTMSGAQFRKFIDLYKLHAFWDEKAESVGPDGETKNL